MARLNTNFKSDKDKIGIIGENWVYNYLINNGIDETRIINTSDIEFFRNLDIDFIVLKNIGKKCTATDICTIYDKILKYYSCLCPNEEIKKKYNKDNFTSYEVKTDTQIDKTGNIAYEIMSHTNPGCLVRTKSDKLLYLGTDGVNITSQYTINIFELRKYIAKNVKKLQVMTRYDGEDQSTFYLIKINDLINNNIAQKIEKPSN